MRSAVCVVRGSALAEQLQALGPIALRERLVHRDPALAARGLVLREVAIVDALAHDPAAACESQTLLGAAVGLLLRHGAVLLHISLSTSAGQESASEASSARASAFACASRSRRDLTSACDPFDPADALRDAGFASALDFAGAMTMTMFRPSWRGAASTEPSSDTSSASRLRSLTPISGPSCLARCGLDRTGFGPVLSQPLEDPDAHLRARLLARAQHDHDLDLVPAVEERHDLALLRLVVVFVDLEPQADLLESRLGQVLP